jgi:hypothetical protein
MGQLVTAATNAYTTWKATKDLATMNESELNTYNVISIRFEKAIEDATEIETAFYAARDEAFQALEQQYQVDRAALASTWQGYENNSFEVTS